MITTREKYCMIAIGFIQKQNYRYLADKSLKWLYNNIASFKIQPEMYQASPWRVKPIAELIFLVSILSKHNVVGKKAKAMTEFVTAETRDFDWHELAAFDPSAATILFTLGAFYQIVGDDVPFEPGYGNVLTMSDYYEAMDRLPYREMEYLYSAALVHKAPEIDIKLLAQWFKNTTFGRHQQHVRYTIDDMYSLTHAIFYLTNVGTRSIDEVLDTQTCVRVRKSLITLAVAIARAGNIDVLGELLLCWIWTDVEMTPTNKIIFNQLLNYVTRYQVDGGAIAPNARVYKLAQNSEVTFFDLYHTTLVSAILFTMVTEKC